MSKIMLTVTVITQVNAPGKNRYEVYTKSRKIPALVVGTSKYDETIKEFTDSEIYNARIVHHIENPFAVDVVSVSQSIIALPTDGYQDA